jgi:hypothetical protein
MGAAGSDMLEGDMDQEHFREAMGEYYDEEEFQALANDEGKIDKQKLLDMSAKTDSFLTHDWGTDELGRNNHERVGQINEALKARGINTWFDSDRMQGNIMAQMCAGIDNTNCFVVFITQNYIEKVGGANAADNCKKEFNYAERRLTGQSMVAVCMEPRCRNPSAWSGPVGMVLGGELYIDFADDLSEEDFNAKVEQLVQAIQSKVAARQAKNA